MCVVIVALGQCWKADFVLPWCFCFWDFSWQFFLSLYWRTFFEFGPVTNLKPLSACASPTGWSSGQSHGTFIEKLFVGNQWAQVMKLLNAHSGRNLTTRPTRTRARTARAGWRGR